MAKRLHYVACALLFSAAVAAAGDMPGGSEPKVVSGMSVIGNSEESPKSLYIVPWETSEIGKDADFTSSIVHEELSPIDKSDFIRELKLYRQSNPD